MAINYMGDFYEAQKKVDKEQERRKAKESENLERMQALTRKYEFLSGIVEQLSEVQKARMNRVPRTAEEWEIFNKDNEDLEKKDKELDAIFLELNNVIADLPFDQDDLKKIWEEKAKEIFGKYNMQN